jgi:hypothetical protein
MPSTTPPVTASMLCAHSTGESCSSEASGHAVSAIRERVTAATPSRWRDGIIVRVSSAGETGGSWIGVDLLDATDTVWAWNHADLGIAGSIGEPVALHELYDTLAIGATRVSVLRVRS